MNSCVLPLPVTSNDGDGNRWMDIVCLMMLCGCLSFGYLDVYFVTYFLSAQTVCRGN